MAPLTKDKGTTMTIHWLGTGLSAIPGLRRLLQAGAPVTVWEIDIDKARAALNGLHADIRAYDPATLGAAIAPGDIVVSMLPADLHAPLAQVAIGRGAHFVCSSYISPDISALADAAQQAGVALIAEIGLDPGIDHLMAHALIADYRLTAQPGDVLRFHSHCGGVPMYPNPFRYKFSWSPLGVLRALRSPSRHLQCGVVRQAARPWLAVTDFNAPLPTPEHFEVYPNRDSLPFIRQYGLDDMQVRDFIRGTIRLKGWTEAWQPVFDRLDRLDDAGLRDLAQQLWRDHAYQPGEPDRVVLCVGLRAERDGATVWTKDMVLDAQGDRRGSAMARLVSTPVALAVEALMAGRIAPGLHAATDDPELTGEWLAEIGNIAQHMALVDHMS